ncbi:MAG: uL15 family ribosomal protein [Candidatus Sungbacteria bacterium]|nr:uL15 family ribosomal protein [Candidatus Sungbacteria bacterium]
MQLHQIKRIHKNKKEIRIGRGGKRGTFSGRGTKGQHARSGAKFHPEERTLIKRIPKLRGYKFKSYRNQPVAVNFGIVEKSFQEGDTINPEVLYKKGLIGKVKGRIPAVKILGGGASTKKKFIFKDVSFSKAFLKHI